MNLLGHSWSRVGFYLLLLVALLHGKYVAAADVSVSIVLKEDIFAPQEKHVHASTLVQAPSGGFLAAWFHGSGERTADDVVIQASWKAAGSEHWGKVFILADTPGFPDCNPVLYRDPQDRLWLFWTLVRAARWEESLAVFQRSTEWPEGDVPEWEDRGLVLLKPGEAFASVLEEDFRELRPKEGLWSSYARQYSKLLIEAARDPAKRQIGWMTRTPPLEDGKGGFLLPMYSDGFNVSLIAWSNDDGRSWSCSEPITGLGNVQPTLVRRKDGTLVAYMRDNGNAPQRAMVSESKDRGRTWSLALDSELPNPGSSLQVLALREGPWIMVMNDTEDGRHRLALYASLDEGASWERAAVIDEAEPGLGSYSYPTAIQSEDGKIHVTYSCKDAEGARIRHAVLELDHAD